MSPELEDKLYSEYPSLFANREDKFSPMVFGCEHGDGWLEIVRAACREIASHGKNSDFRFDQIKEKFGTLRMYHSGGGDFAEGVIAMAEAMSAVTCERCGAPGKPNDGGWISTLCEGCRK